MEIPSAPNPLAALPDTIVEEVACRKCGYNLRGLSMKGNCPECGTPTSLTVAGDRLRFSDPDWLETVARGCRFIVIGIAATFALGCVMAVVVITGIGGVVGGSMGALSGLVGFLIALIGYYGAWLMTAPEPARVGADKTITARKLVRFGIGLGVLQSLLHLAIDPTRSSQGLLQLAFIVLGIIVGLAWVVGEFAKYLYMQKLAERIPDLKMAGRAKFVRWAYSILLGVSILLGAVATIGAFMGLGSIATAGGTATTMPATTTGPGQPAVASGITTQFTLRGGTSMPTSMTSRSVSVGTGVGVLAFGCVTSLVGLGFFIVWVMAFLLTNALAKRLREEARESRLLWQAAAIPAPPSISS